MRGKFIPTFMYLVSTLIFFMTLLQAPISNADQADLLNLKQNFKELYRDDYMRFWHLVHQAAEKAGSCDSVRDTSDFLDLIRLGRGSAEFDEFYKEMVERLSTSRTQCFLDALLTLDGKTISVIVCELNHAIFREQKDIDEAFARYKDAEKYKDVVKFYFSSRECVW